MGLRGISSEMERKGQESFRLKQTPCVFRDLENERALFRYVFDILQCMLQSPGGQGGE